MKKIFILLIFILLSLVELFSQWSTDPNNNLIVGYGLFPNICSDSAGGCYITYEYGTTGYPRKLGLERLDKYGYKPWGINKRILGEYPQQYRAKIVEDGEGGVIVSYIDRYENLPTWFERVRVQRIDSSGNFLWGPTGVRVTLEEINHSLQAVISDGSGGCVVAWQDVNDTYYVNRIDHNGNRLWGNNGKTLNTGGSNSLPILVKASDGNYYLQAGTITYRLNQYGEIQNQFSSTILGQPVADPEGGIVLSGIVGSITNRRLVAQRKDSLGNNLWQEPYVEIADSVGPGSFRVGINQRIINYSWLGTYNGQTGRPYFQSINMEGTIVHPNKILLSSDSSGITIIGIIASCNMNTFFSWSITSELNSIYAQMYDTLGNKLWNENGIIVAHPRMTYQQYITDGRGGFIIAGLINNFTVVAQQVSKNGYLGEIITNVNANHNNLIDSELSLGQNFPNPFNATTKIGYTIPASSKNQFSREEWTYVVLKIFDVLGNEVATVVNEFLDAGRYEVQFNASELSSGIYYYKLKYGNQSIIKKMILLK